MCTSDRIHKSFECVYIRIEFGIMLVCVRADKVKDHVNVLTFRNCLGPCERAYVWTEFVGLCKCLYVFTEFWIVSVCENVWTEFGIM